MGKKTNDYDISLRLIRPLLHFLLILLIFYGVYKLRLVTDLIPLVQLEIPVINLYELYLYALISGVAFVWIGILKKLYELNKPIQNYFKTFTKVRIYWIIFITFASYFWAGFIFKFWISRFIILIWGLLTYIVLFLFDQARNKLESIIHKNWDNKILIIWDNSPDSYDIVSKIQEWFSFKTEFIQLADIKDIDLKKYFIVIAAWIFKRDDLQNMLEELKEKSKLSMSAVVTSLLSMELKGACHCCPGKIYRAHWASLLDFCFCAYILVKKTSFRASAGAFFDSLQIS